MVEPDFVLIILLEQQTAKLSNSNRKKRGLRLLKLGAHNLIESQGRLGSHWTRTRSQPSHCGAPLQSQLGWKASLGGKRRWGEVGRCWITLQNRSIVSGESQQLHAVSHRFYDLLSHRKCGSAGALMISAKVLLKYSSGFMWKRGVQNIKARLLSTAHWGESLNNE